MVSLTLKNLQKAVTAAGITSPAEFEALSLRLSRGQARLYVLLYERGECSTTTIRTTASIGNISEAAKAINAKLVASGDSRRVVCETRRHENKFGERGYLGWWSLVEPEQAAA